MTVSTQQYLTLEEYFEFEYKSGIRHEYLDGKLRPMTYTSPNRGRIVGNISRIIGNCFLDTNSEIWTESRMLFVPDCNKIYYPDGLIVVGESKYHNYSGKMDATLNPSVLIEIGSDSTEKLDKSDKWQCYQTIPSLQQYVLISQQTPFVEIFDRQEEDPTKWTYSSAQDMQKSVTIRGSEVALKDLYHKVDFPPKSEEEEVIG